MPFPGVGMTIEGKKGGPSAYPALIKKDPTSMTMGLGKVGRRASRKRRQRQQSWHRLTGEKLRKENIRLQHEIRL